MVRLRRRWVVLGLLGGLLAFVVLSAGPPAPTPNPPGTFAFAALGDAPYYPWEVLKFRQVRQALDEHDLSFVVHVGDIFWRPCSDEHYRTALGRFNGLRHAVMYTPGDNEWADCWESASGSYVPLERLASLRRIFFADPAYSVGGRRIPVLTQASRPDFSEFVENARWKHAGLIFATVHIIGSDNGLRTGPNRTPPDDAEVRRRSEAGAAWLRETFAEAVSTNAPAVVIAFHAGIPLDKRPDDRERLVFEPFLQTLEETAAAFKKPVLVVHGDDHEYTVDHPFKSRASGQAIENLTRLMVPGSPDVGWVRIVVSPGAAQPFQFNSLVVPRWKYW
jgi:hypothetical protein